MQVFPVDCIGAKNLDLIACTPARYRRFSRKRSWEASKGTRARGLAGSASLPRALSLVQISSSSVPEKRLYLPASITISARSNKFASKWRDYDLQQIENAFRDPEDGFWGENSSESPQVYQIEIRGQCGSFATKQLNQYSTFRSSELPKDSNKVTGLRDPHSRVVAAQEVLPLLYGTIGGSLNISLSTNPVFSGRHFVRVKPLEVIFLCGFRCYPLVICRV